MSEIKVNVFDPGGTTGYATGIIDDGLMKCKSGQAVWNHIQLFSQLKLSEPDVIVYESFEFRKKAQIGVDLIPREYIGVIRLYGQLREREDKPCDVYVQSAATGKGHFTDDKLKAAKLYRKGNPHANDAMRHLLQWYNFGAGYQYNSQGYEPL